MKRKLTISRASEAADYKSIPATPASPVAQNACSLGEIDALISNSVAAESNFALPVAYSPELDFGCNAAAIANAAEVAASGSQGSIEAYLADEYRRSPIVDNEAR